MPSLSRQENEQGESTVELLSRVNPLLVPSELGELIPEYMKFHPFLKSLGLWSNLETMMDTLTNRSQFDKVILLVSGIAGGGKDAMRGEIERVAPETLFKLVTATSRKPRKGEIDGKDYHFFKDTESFQKSVENDEFIEWVDQNGRFYGIPKTSLRDGLNQSSPVIWTQVEMGGWPSVEEYVKTQTDKKIYVLKMFILPYMDFTTYSAWLDQERVDADTRLTRSGWEILEASKRSDYIVSNRFGEDNTPLTLTAQAVVNQATYLLANRDQFIEFPSTFGLTPSISDPTHILDFHDRELKNRVSG